MRTYNRNGHDTAEFTFLSGCNMTATQMISLMNRTPFEPFEIHLTEGARIRVEHPYEIATRPKNATCIIFDDDEGMRIVAYRNITEVVTKATAS
jgi:hypothetical protein